MTTVLAEIPLPTNVVTIPEKVPEFAAEGLRRGKKIDCFDFVPSSSMMLYNILSSLPKCRFCEWGSGIGIGVGIASMLGFEAHGIELDPKLAAASRKLLRDFDLAATIDMGSYFELQHEADLYFNYTWPSRWQAVEDHFATAAPKDAQLLMCHGAEDIRLKVVRRPGRRRKSARIR